MGLDISYYRRVKLDPEAGEDSWDTRARLYVNSAFPAQADGLADGWYEYAESDGFRAGSYSGYGDWRNWLARLAGYPACPDARVPHAAGAWAASSGPFWELIKFSDCEGVIGPVTSAKLARDFAEWDDRAKAADNDGEGYRYALYGRLREAFEAATDSGAVDFH